MKQILPGLLQEFNSGTGALPLDEHCWMPPVTSSGGVDHAIEAL